MAAPVFDDAEKTRQAGPLYSTLQVGCLLTTLSSVALFLVKPNFLAGLGAVLTILLLCLLGFVALRQGYVRLVSLLLPAGMWVSITVAVLLTGGLHGLGISAYITVILVAGLFVGLRTGAFYFGLTTLSSLLMLWAERSGFLPPPLVTLTSEGQVIIQIIIFAWIIDLVSISTRDLNAALARAHSNEAALAQSVLEQHNTRAELLAQMNNLERRLIQLQVAAAVARDAATLQEVNVFLNNAVHLVRDRFGFYHAGIFLVDERGQFAILSAATGEAGQQMLAAGHKLKVGEVGIVGYVAGTGQPRIALDVGADAVYFKNPVLPETRSELALPLKVGQNIIGALDVQSKQAAAFDNDDIAILQTMADQLAVAIENARLFEATQRQVQELSILHAVANAAADASSVDILIERATELIGNSLFPDHFGVLLIDEAAAVLRFHPSYRGLANETKQIALPLGRGISGQVAILGRPMRVSDVTREIAYVDVHVGMRSELCVPLKIGERVIGVINAENARSNAFTAADERLLSTFAGQLATAIEKVRLFEAERRRAAELEALRQASLHLTSNLELKAVLDAILEHAIQLLGSHTAHLFLYDGEDLTFGTALWAPGHEGRPFDQPRPNGLTYNVAHTGQRMVVPNVYAHPLFQDNPWHGAVVGLPLRRGQEVIGVMNLSFEGGPHDFDENELRVLELLADQAAIALLNARLYAEAQERARELALALEEREELDRLKNEFIQNASHELRTPLAITRGYIELMENGDLGEIPKEQREAVSIISRRITMLVRLVDDLVTILEAEGREIEHEKVNLSEIVQRAVQDFQAAATRENLTLTAEIEPALPSVMGNVSHLNRLLDNLVGNAIKFTPPEGNIHLTLYRQDKNVVLEVTDTGIGIPEDKLDRIFERFYQVDGSTTRRFGGTGLGLSLVKQIAESHGGSVSVKSELGHGSSFTVIIPFTHPQPVKRIRASG